MVEENVTIHGAGSWYSVLKGEGQTQPEAVGVFAQQGPKGTAAIGLYDFAIVGDVRERDDAQPVQGIGGAPTGGSTVQGLWIQHTKCGLWLDGPGDGLIVADVIVRDTMADGINLHIGWTDVTIEHCSFRNTGDDGIALWSQNEPDSGIKIQFNTVQLPILANSIAIYGGHDITVLGNTVADTVQGGGIHVGNRFKAASLAGTNTIKGNTVKRCGALDQNWHFGLGAIWFYALDDGGTMTGTINVEDNMIVDSPQAALFILGNTVSGISFTNLTIDTAATFVLQFRGIKAPSYGMVDGSASFTGVKATGVKYHSIYSCMGNASNTFKLIDRGGNTGWLHSCSTSSACAAAEPNTTCTGPPKAASFCEHCGFPSGVPNALT
jgi:hypothetical protein